MGYQADKAPDISGKGFWLAIGLILLCALALYFGGKQD